MTLTRRRFLSVSAAAMAGLAAGPGAAQTWHGQAMGADVGLTIRAPRNLADAAIRATRATLREVEALFSLYDPASALSRLNREGRLIAPDARFVALMGHAARAHALTEGRFDPTVQPLWQALAKGADPGAARDAVGWGRVRHDRQAIRLAPGQALTLNGIAQGYATDLVAARLRGLGLGEVLVNIGEYRALGGPFRLALADPAAGELGHLTLQEGAVATSSPGAMLMGNAMHILHPHHAPQWSSVTVEAREAVLADSLSTALCLGGRDLAARLRQTPGVGRIWAVDFDGNLARL